MKTIACMLAVLALLLGAVMPLAAQEDTYIVQKGDHLWKLAGVHLGSNTLWEQIYKDNPFLQEPGRRFQKDGVVYVMIRPGEKLVGLDKLGIMAEMTPIEQLKLPQPDPVVYKVPTTPTYVWWLLALAFLLFIAALLIYRMLTRDPVNSRPAMIPGGVRTKLSFRRFSRWQHVLPGTRWRLQTIRPSTSGLRLFARLLVASGVC